MNRNLKLVTCLTILTATAGVCWSQGLIATPQVAVDTTALTAQIKAAQQAAQAAQQAAAQAQQTANTANGLATTAVQPSALNGYATTAAVQQAQATATSANALATTAVQPAALAALATPASVAAQITAATPADCPAPLSDGLTSTAGTQARCMPRVDRQRATVIQATTATTNSTGDFSGTWPAAFANTPTGRSATVEVTNSNAAPYFCSFYSGQVTATTFAGHCWQIVATTLPTTVVAIQGLVVSPLSNAAAGLTVRIVGRQ